MPKGRIPELFDLVDDAEGRGISCRFRASVTSATATSTSTSWCDGDDAGAVRRAHEAEGELFRGVVALEGSISGEHGIGFTKAPYLGLELTPETIALMKRVKHAFDPHGILNPGKIFR